ncbi:YifB family Mg chelatase-like AAA ATPase [Microbacterium sp. YY-01]|uniref:YifB family Mg chelatase-like AAA ATPase n=1 Tax=Microbacterium sp. YY-01 TaxID=3421634 RepID=UPI003D16E213
MTTARTWTVAVTGIVGNMIEVEANLSSQTPGFFLIGLADKALSEAVSRVQNACQNSGMQLPRRRLTVNLSPASLPKHGAGLDLSIAIAALATEHQLDQRSAASTVHLGELGLDGRVRPVAGVLPAVQVARDAGFSRVVVPWANRKEAELVDGVTVHAVKSLAEAAVLHGASVAPADVTPVDHAGVAAAPSQAAELADVVGQADAVEALIVAAAGGHNMLLSGPPGAGKTMLARRLPAVLPPLSDEEALEATSVRSISGEPVTALDRDRPFVAPHHGASLAALVGGGSRTIRPGAIVRAHRGVLFLDEAAEFTRSALDALRQPLEAGHIEIHRAGFTAAFPARFQLILATNPCPCGAYGVVGEECLCTPMAVRRYASRLSGPLRDRIDIELHVRRVPAAMVTQPASGTTTTAQAAAKVVLARDRSRFRLRDTPWQVNADVPGTWLRRPDNAIPAQARAPLDIALQRGLLTLRSYDRIVRLAWSIADLDAADIPTIDHVGRALFFKKGLHT